MHGSKPLGIVTVDSVYAGMRGVRGLLYETSLLDPEEGIRFRGYTIAECQRLLPKSKGEEQPLPEGLFWLLVTGEIPTEEQVESLCLEWKQRAESFALPAHVQQILKSEAVRSLHPMTQLSIGILLLQSQSIFARDYAVGCKKENFWDSTFEDISNLISILPEIASIVYGNVTNCIQPRLKSNAADWGGRFACSLGFPNPRFQELLRLYLVLHADHEGGNVSAHATHLVGSALSDPFLAYASGVCGLAGPLHGLANQEVLRWMHEMVKQIGVAPTDDQIRNYAWGYLNSGKVIPGYGHAVLRKTDPRYTCQREFCQKNLSDDPYFLLTSKCFRIIPEVLAQQGKTKNPWPNVDAHSGIILQHYGLVQQSYYTVLFAVSRSLGALAGLLWDRILGLPIERPKSLTTESIKKIVASLGTESTA